MANRTCVHGQKVVMAGRRVPVPTVPSSGRNTSKISMCFYIMSRTTHRKVLEHRNTSKRLYSCIINNIKISWATLPHTRKMQTFNHHVAASRMPYGEQEHACEYDLQSQPDTDFALDDEQFARIAILQAFSCISDCIPVGATKSLQRQSGLISRVDNEFKAEDWGIHSSRSHAHLSQAAQYTGVLG